MKSKDITIGHNRPPKSLEEIIAVNQQLADQVWNDDEKFDYGKAKDDAAKEIGIKPKKVDPAETQMRKYNEGRTKERTKTYKK